MNEEPMEPVNEEAGNPISEEQARAEDIFRSLLLGQGCARIDSILAASADALGLDDAPKNLGFVSLRMFGMSAACDTGEEEVDALIDQEHPWSVVFCADAAQLTGMIDALTEARDYVADVNGIRGAETPEDLVGE